MNRYQYMNSKSPVNWRKMKINAYFFVEDLQKIYFSVYLFLKGNQGYCDIVGK